MPPATMPPAPIDAYRILIFDDEPEMCEVARDQILALPHSDGIYVEFAYTGSVAVDRVRKTVFDLILLDLFKFKELIGYEVFRRLNELGCSTEVILMTKFDLDPAIKPLMRAIASQGELRVVSFLDKRESRQSRSIRHEVGKRY